MRSSRCNRRVASARLAGIAGIALLPLAQGTPAAETVEILIQDYTFTPEIGRASCKERVSPRV